MPQPEPAHRDSHHLRKDPGPMEAIPYEDRFTADEARRLALGLIPEDMGEKWFVYCEEGTLFFHRSWTGNCLYTVTLESDGDGQRVAEAHVALDPEQYKRWTDEYECAMARLLVRDLLLDQPMPFPLRDDDPSDVPAILLEHRAVGTKLSDRALGVDRSVPTDEQ